MEGWRMELSVDGFCLDGKTRLTRDADFERISVAAADVSVRNRQLTSEGRRLFVGARDAHGCHQTLQCSVQEQVVVLRRKEKVSEDARDTHTRDPERGREMSTDLRPPDARAT